MNKSKKAVGIDLGTTNSCAAYMELGLPKVIKNKRGGRTLPSVVSFDDKGIPSVGEVAKRQRFVNPDKTIMSVKRKMGSNEKIQIGAKSYTAEEISGFILREIRGYVSDCLNEDVVDVVITVPAYFNDTQRASTQDAAQLAGLNTLRIINEPTAAALAYKFNKSQNAENILVYDLGGGTFDVSVLSVDDGVFQVKATSGDNRLGGDDFDAKIYAWVVNEISSKTGERIEAIARERIMEAVEKAKCDLSSSDITRVQLPLIVPNFSLDIELTRARFDHLTSDLLERTRGPTLNALEASQLSINEISNIVLVGGSTRLVSVKKLVREMFNKEPVQDIDPDEVVALGAAIEAGVKLGTVSDIVLVDVTPLSLGIEVVGNKMDFIIERNSKIPTEKKKQYTTAVDNQTTASIAVFQGERPIATANHRLGEFAIDFPAGPRGSVQIEVTFYIDENGILNVTAKDTKTNQSKSIKILRQSMNEEDKNKAIREAEQYADQDRRQSLVSDMRVTLQEIGFSIEKKNESADTSEETKAKLAEVTQRCSDLAMQLANGEKTDEEIAELAKQIADVQNTLSSL